MNKAYRLHYREPGRRAGTTRWAKPMPVDSVREALEWMNSHKDIAFLPASVMTPVGADKESGPVSRPKKENMKIHFANGKVVTGFDSLESALGFIRESDKLAYACDSGGFEVNEDKDRTDGSRILVWETEEHSENDDGRKAIAEIRDDEDTK